MLSKDSSQYWDNLRHVVQNWDQPPAAFVITGGGFQLSMATCIPGSSKFIAEMYTPYGMEEEISFMREIPGFDPKMIEGFGFTSAEVTDFYIDAMNAKRSYRSGLPQVPICVINASLTSSRWRRGKNLAYIGVFDADLGRKEIYLLKLNKLSQQEYDDLLSIPGSNAIERLRFKEDQKVSEVALALLVNNPSMINLLEENETVLRVNPDFIHKSGEILEKWPENIEKGIA